MIFYGPRGSGRLLLCQRLNQQTPNSRSLRSHAECLEDLYLTTKSLRTSTWLFTLELPPQSLLCYSIILRFFIYSALSTQYTRAQDPQSPQYLPRTTETPSMRPLTNYTNPISIPKPFQNQPPSAQHDQVSVLTTNRSTTASILSPTLQSPTSILHCLKRITISQPPAPTQSRHYAPPVDINTAQTIVPDDVARISCYTRGETRGIVASLWTLRSSLQEVSGLLSAERRDVWVWGPNMKTLALSVSG